jgi:hypothetical protein
LLKVNADMVHATTRCFEGCGRTWNTGRAVIRTVLAAALLVLVGSDICRAQHLDLASTVIALPLAATSLAAQTGAQQQFDLSASGCIARPGMAKITIQNQRRNWWYRATNKGLNLTHGDGLQVIGALLPRWNLAAQMGSEGGTAPGNTFNSMAWQLPNFELGASPYPPPTVRVAWMPSIFVGPCPTP